MEDSSRTIVNFNSGGWRSAVLTYRQNYGLGKREPRRVYSIMSSEDARRILKHSNSVTVDPLLGLGSRRFSTRILSLVVGRPWF